MKSIRFLVADILKKPYRLKKDSRIRNIVLELYETDWTGELKVPLKMKESAKVERFVELVEILREKTYLRIEKKSLKESESMPLMEIICYVIRNNGFFRLRYRTEHMQVIVRKVFKSSKRNCLVWKGTESPGLKEDVKINNYILLVDLLSRRENLITIERTSPKREIQRKVDEEARRIRSQKKFIEEKKLMEENMKSNLGRRGRGLLLSRGRRGRGLLPSRGRAPNSKIRSIPSRIFDLLVKKLEMKHYEERRGEKEEAKFFSDQAEKVMLDGEFRQHLTVEEVERIERIHALEEICYRGYGTYAATSLSNIEMAKRRKARMEMEGLQREETKEDEERGKRILLLKKKSEN